MQEHYCHYCNSLQKALDGQNFCSKHQQSAATVKTNAFYLRSQQMSSGKHISRWTIRGVLNGEQFYKSGKNDHLVTPDQYLIIPEGQPYFSEIDTHQQVEGIVVAFQTDFVQRALYQFTHDSQHLAEHPFEKTNEIPAFLESLYPNTAKVRQHFERIKQRIVDKEMTPLFLEEVYSDLLQETMGNHRKYLHNSERVPVKKKALREELFRRLNLGRDYLHAHLADDIELADISRVSMLSPFHFLRLFKKVYGNTPHQYLTIQRISQAKNLLKQQKFTVKEVCEMSGFENHSSFSRLFKLHVGCQPSEYVYFASVT